LPILAGRKDDSEAEDEETLETILKNSSEDADNSEKQDNPGVPDQNLDD
jgi:hypothetical protein